MKSQRTPSATHLSSYSLPPMHVTEILLIVWQILPVKQHFYFDLLTDWYAYNWILFKTKTA
jgi:hypothetical protein